jgi:cysteine-rich repeat protein
MSNSTKIHYLWYCLNNGKLRVESKYYSGGNGISLPDRETSSSSMYKVGWNMICFTEGSSTFNMISFPHFSTSSLSGSGASTNYRDRSGFWANLGGYYIENSGFIKSFQGIIHSAFIKESTMSAATIATTWLVPRISPSYLCDYYIGMFNNFGEQLTGSSFNNQMYNYAGQTQMLTNSIASTVDVTNGLSFSATEVQAIQGVIVTVQRAIGVQFWFKGSFNDAQTIASISKSGSVKNAFLDRTGTDVRLRSTQTATMVTLSNAAGSINSSMWTLVSFSVGWLARNNDFIMCAYIYQAGNYDSGSCSSTFTISTADMGSSVTLYIEFGPGLIGTLKEAYVTNHLGTPHIFSLFKSSMGTQRYHWFVTNSQLESHYITTGCGNGYILPGDSGETCDDLNTSGGDGCSGSWIMENLYKCTQFTGVAGISSCALSCGDGLYESIFGEAWDDGNTSNLDGWDSACQIENKWSWSGAIETTSTCNPICGDNYRITGEAWDDGNNLDGQGCKADCSGELPGWHWSGGSASSKDICVEQWGDGYVTISEQWEDGNTSSLDGWSSTCQIESGWNWVGTIGLNPTACASIWGDNFRVFGEAWDDGDNTDNQGWKADCSGELPGWHWSGGSATTKDTWTEQCGDGYVTPNEQWEDGNTSNLDGCSSTCQIEPGWNWIGTVGLNPTTCISIWGDNYRVAGKAWDDGNNSDNQGCKADCTGELPGWHWTGGSASSKDTCVEQWGDGYVTISEQWEDGNTSSLDGWSSTCQIESGWNWVGTVGLNPTTCASIWGDNFRVFGEAWDDGDNTDNQGWKADCSGELNGWHWSGGSATTKDTWTEQCGDGYVTPNEQWEDGNTSNLDGCSSTCQIEPGWNWVGTVGLNPTSCTPIWGDNYRVAGEAWDDGDNTDNQGCKADCSGELNGWHCSGGSATTKDTWIEQCNDGYITTNEQCEDGNTSGGDGWDSNCQTETGWTWVNDVAMTSSICTPIWGDGLVVGPETCDDGDDTDNKGCNDQWSGIIRGWYWSLNLSAPPAHICNTQLMDGIHMSPEEGWDDGNSLNLNDGCTNSGIIEYKWDWVDDLLQRSIWVPMWGNGKQDHADEECDDENYDDDDGCTNWLIDQGYQCFNGSATTRDNWYKQPIAEISYLSEINELTIKFTEPMENIDVMDKLNLNLTITGPMAPYQFTYKAGFEDEYTMMVNITMTSQMAGDDEDLYTLYFNTDVFVSKYEPKLITKKLYGFLYKVPILPNVIGAIGSSTNNIMSTTLVALVVSNVLLGESSELLWGFMNTIQIMFFFPLLMLYFPDHLTAILTYLKSAKMIIEFPLIEGFKSEIRNKIEFADKINMTSVNERYESLEYYSASILLNGEDIFALAFQGLVICMIVFALRACLFTLQCNISVYEEELEKMEKGIKINSSPVAVNPKSKKEKFNRWFKNKIKEMSQEYKFNFFLRMIIQLFLETIILSLLNIRLCRTTTFTKWCRPLSHELLS